MRGTVAKRLRRESRTGAKTVAEFKKRYKAAKKAYKSK